MLCEKAEVDTRITRTDGGNEASPSTDKWFEKRLIEGIGRRQPVLHEKDTS